VAHRHRLEHLLTVSEGITRSALERRESRGGIFGTIFRLDAAGQDEHRVVQGRDGFDANPAPTRIPSRQIIEEMK
jgi:succinate dehydrogenase/fumarate reductase flavoprotein subunit